MISSKDLSLLDRPDIRSVLFHPRPEYAAGRVPGTARDLLVPLADGTVLGGRFHRASADAPTLLFFHGNGEIVADYDDVGPLFTKTGCNFLPVDYRGYGRSTGTPTMASLVEDCHEVLDYAKVWLGEQDIRGPLAVMGRSLGSAPALELAARRGDELSGLVIESGFAFLLPLIRLMGIDPGKIGISEELGRLNLEKIKTVTAPTLVIHAEYDHIIPLSDGEALWNASPARDKQFLMIPGADHNTIFMQGLGQYLEAISRFMAKVAGRE